MNEFISGSSWVNWIVKVVSKIKKKNKKKELVEKSSFEKI